MTVRRRLDAYYTHRAQVTALLDHVPEIGRYGLIAEPCAGGLDIAATLAVHGRRVVTGDIDPRLAHMVDHVHDARKEDSPIWRARPEWCITNPPYSAAFDILRVAFKHSSVGVALLLRLSFLEPILDRGRTPGRGEWLEQHQDHLAYIMPFGTPRPSYTRDGGTDSVTTCWLVWLRERVGCARVRFLREWQ